MHEQNPLPGRRCGIRHREAKIRQLEQKVLRLLPQAERGVTFAEGRTGRVNRPIYRFSETFYYSETQKRRYIRRAKSDFLIHVNSSFLIIPPLLYERRDNRRNSTRSTLIRDFTRMRILGAPSTRRENEFLSPARASRTFLPKTHRW